jgi:glucose/mannose transport system substrate-binding protein
MQRILGGDAPQAAQFNNSRQFEELAEAGLLLDLSDLAKKEKWRDVVRPKSILDPCEIDGKIYCVPVNIHSDQWLWTNKAIYKEVGLEEPQSWQDVIDQAGKIRDAGYIPLAVGGQGWQEDLTFDDVFMGVGGKELWNKVYVDRDEDAAKSPEVAKVFETYAKLRDLTDEGSAGRNWNDTTSLVINGKAAAQAMGDWARGEFVLAGKTAEVDYGCVPGPSVHPILTTGGDIFIFPKQDDADKEAAQLRLASMLLSPDVQVKFNTAKGSSPVRGDVNMASADPCMQKGLALLNDDANIALPKNAILSSDTDGRIQDLVSQFWNTPSMTVADVQDQFAHILQDGS